MNLSYFVSRFKKEQLNILQKYNTLLLPVKVKKNHLLEIRKFSLVFKCPFSRDHCFFSCPVLGNPICFVLFNYSFRTMTGTK